MNKYVFIFIQTPRIDIPEEPNIATSIYIWPLNSLTGIQIESALLKGFLMAAAAADRTLVIWELKFRSVSEHSRVNLPKLFYSPATTTHNILHTNEKHCIKKKKKAEGSKSWDLIHTGTN